MLWLSRVLEAQAGGRVTGMARIYIRTASLKGDRVLAAVYEEACSLSGGNV